MKKSKTALLSGHDSILYAQALIVRIHLLESAFRLHDKKDKKQSRLLVFELGTAYSALMRTPEATRRFIQIIMRHD